MAGVVDTNLLLYAANADADEHAAARAFLSEVAASPERWYLTEGILYEFLRVSTHARVFPQPLRWQQAVSFLAPLWSAANVSILSATDAHWPLLGAELDRLPRPAGNLFFDVRTVVLMREHGVRELYTADTDFLQFEDLVVIDPLREPRRATRPT